MTRIPAPPRRAARQLTAIAVGLALVLTLALIPVLPGVLPGYAGLNHACAQGSDDWAAIYRPALLPDFVGDMAAYAGAPRYDIDLTLQTTAEGATITGRQTVQYTNRTTTAALDEIVFRLYPNLFSFGGEMQVSGVTVGGAAVTPVLDDTGSVLRVPLSPPGPASALEPGASVVIEMDFMIRVVEGRRRLYGQFSYARDVLALPNAYPVLAVYEPGVGWWTETAHPQGDAVFSETAFYTVDVTAPAGMVLVASGSLIGTDGAADGAGADAVTYRYVAPLMRDFALFASPNFELITDVQDGVTINVYYDPDSTRGRISAQAGLAITQEAVRVFNASFGRYPFSELDVVQTPTTAGGIEYPGVFVVGRDVWNNADPFFEFVVVHEAAHQWWYSLVGNDQTRDPWIDEALAQYAVAVYIRDREGVDAYDAALASFQREYDRFIGAHSGPVPVDVIGLPVTAYASNAYFYLVYQKGPLFYALLDDLYGYDAVIGMLQDLFATYRYAIIAPADVQRSFESSLGVDLDDIFEEWVGTFPVG